MLRVGFEPTIPVFELVKVVNILSVCSHLLTLVPRSRIFLPWSWRQCVPPKRRCTQDLHSATSQKTAFFSSRLISQYYGDWLLFFLSCSIRDLSVSLLCSIAERMTSGCVAGDRMRTGKGNGSTRRKLAPLLLCPPQILHDLNWYRTRSAVLGSRWLTFQAKAWPYTRGFVHVLTLRLT
jgi:hypothetical protein